MKSRDQISGREQEAIQANVRRVAYLAVTDSGNILHSDGTKIYDEHDSAIPHWPEKWIQANSPPILTIIKHGNAQSIESRKEAFRNAFFIDVKHLE